MSFPIGDVPKVQSNWDLIKNGLSSWITTKEEAKIMQPTLKRTISETTRKEPIIPKRSSVSLRTQNSLPLPHTGYSILNEKIRFILQDTRNFNERIDLFSGTSKEDKEYLDIEEVLFYNLTELVQIRSPNTKLKQQKLDAILIVQEKIKRLDLKLEENIEKAMKRIGYTSGTFVPEGKSKPKTPQKPETPNNDLKNKRKRLHFQVVKHSVPLPLVDEINKIKTSLKSCGENRQNRKNQIFKSLAKMKIPEDKETIEEAPEPEHPFTEEINKIKNNLQSFVEKKPNRKSQINNHLSLLEISEDAASSSKNVQDQKVTAVASDLKLPEEIQSESYEPCLQEQATDTELEEEEEEEFLLPEKSELEEIPNPEFNPNLAENRRFSLVKVLSTPFAFKRNNSITNTLKLIQNCLQEAQNHFEYFKNNHQQLTSPQYNDASEQTLETIPDIPEKMDENKSENNMEGSLIQAELGKTEEVIKTNQVESVDNRQITALLVQIRLLLFLTVLKILQTPIEIVFILIAALWYWERH